jgi:putative acetyltransferase
MQIDHERPEDVGAIRALTMVAFRDIPYSNQAEAKIIDALRDGGALMLSLVARANGEIDGHAAFSPVRINGRPSRWCGLGPVSVRPDLRRSGIGSAIIEHGLERLRAMNLDGCVVFGDPLYYRRFGFASDPGLRYADAPDGYFHGLSFHSVIPTGEVTYHSGFNAA